MTHHPMTAVAFALAFALSLAGCGGGDLPASEAAAPQLDKLASAATELAPADSGARTRQGRYLTAEQARELARRVDDRLVTVEARCCGPEQSELDVLVAFGVQAAADLPDDAPFVVSGSDLRQAAAVANRLSEFGAKKVYLVTR